MQHITGVNVVSRDRPEVVEDCGTIGGTSCTLAAARACTRSVEGGEFSVGTAQESVLHAVRVNIGSGDRPPLIEARGTAGTTRALVGASARTGSFECF